MRLQQFAAQCALAVEQLRTIAAEYPDWDFERNGVGNYVLIDERRVWRYYLSLIDGECVAFDDGECVAFDEPADSD